MDKIFDKISIQKKLKVRKKSAKTRREEKYLIRIQSREEIGGTEGCHPGI